MFSINELKTILKPHFKIDNRRLDCFIQILVALITVRTVNLVDIAGAMVTGGLLESRYKRVRRFFKEFKGFQFETLSVFIAQFFLPKGGKWQLSMDRTNWQWGKRNINILVLSVVCGTVSIPVVWKFLDKKGNSNFEERMEVVNRFIAIFGQSMVGELLADREFVSKEWFEWLLKKEIRFTIRIKKNVLVDSAKGELVAVRNLFMNLRRSQVRFFKGAKDIFGVSLWLAATRSADDEWVIVATTHAPEDALMRYKKRWCIETLFGFLKSKGFNFEDTHMTNQARLHNLLAILSIAFCLAYKLGEIIAKEAPIKKKGHGRLEKSVFRVGLDVLRETFFQVKRSIKNVLIEKISKPIHGGLVEMVFSGC